MLLSQLLLVGEQLALPSEGEEFSSAVSRIKEELSLFSSALAYDPSWGGVVHIRGRCDCQGESDEGNPYYRGHHWQYGYYLYAYAVLGRYDLPWLQKQDTPLLLVRDIANPSANDPWFPYSRHKDWFFGGSIGNGLSPLQYKGREYSRIGETINAYYAVHLLSGLLGYSSLRTHAECLLDSEMEGLRHYHQLRGGVAVSSAESQDPVVWEWSDSGYRYPPIGMLKALAEIVLPASPISRSILSREWVETLLLSLPTELREEPLSQLLRMRCGEDLFSLLVQEEPREDLPPTLLLHWLLTEE
jgi:endo-1,3(4)-beta-glucanase